MLTLQFCNVKIQNEKCKLFHFWFVLVFQCIFVIFLVKLHNKTISSSMLRFRACGDLSWAGLVLHELMYLYVLIVSWYGVARVRDENNIEN